MLDSAPSTTVEASKDDLLEMFETMYTMRRMEITCVRLDSLSLGLA